MKKTTKNKKSKPTKAKAAPIRPRGVYKKSEFEEYGLFCALGAVERKEIFGFTTDAEFAESKALNPCTLTDWKYRDELWEVRDRYMVHFKKHTAAIISKLAHRAEKSGDFLHVQTFMKLVEGWVEKSGIDLTSKGKKVTGFNVVIRHANNSPTSSTTKTE